jgi:hypothetical protein
MLVVAPLAVLQAEREAAKAASAEPVSAQGSDAPVQA